MVCAVCAAVSLSACAGMKNSGRPVPPSTGEGRFFTVSDGAEIFVYTYAPELEIEATIYILSGITGINHRMETDVIKTLAGKHNRIVVIHPRGTGYSSGTRGDIQDFHRFLKDYVEIINADFSGENRPEKLVLFGHSMSTAIAMHAAAQLSRVDGIILVNPPYSMKESEGMTPGCGAYINYAGYYIFAPHTPVVNMAGDPALIKNEKERREAIERGNDPLLVRYFSMYMMSESRKLMDRMVEMAALMEMPLLLVYGTDDSIVDKKGCDEIYSAWKSTNKKYLLIENGPHGKQTVIEGGSAIRGWIHDSVEIN